MGTMKNTQTQEGYNLFNTSNVSNTFTKTKKIETVVTTMWFTVENCRAYPNSLFIFGDNLDRYGMAGQAQIRKENNSTGLATKIHPGMNSGDFFSDENFEALKEKIDTDIMKIKKRFEDKNFKVIVFPFAGLGTGLSELPKRAPKLFAYLSRVLESEFGIGTFNDGTLYKKNTK